MIRPSSQGSGAGENNNLGISIGNNTGQYYAENDMFNTAQSSQTPSQGGQIHGAAGASMDLMSGIVQQNVNQVNPTALCVPNALPQQQQQQQASIQAQAAAAMAAVAASSQYPPLFGTAPVAPGIPPASAIGGFSGVPFNIGTPNVAGNAQQQQQQQQVVMAAALQAAQAQALSFAQATGMSLAAAQQALFAPAAAANGGLTGIVAQQQQQHQLNALFQQHQRRQQQVQTQQQQQQQVQTQQQQQVQNQQHQQVQNQQQQQLVQNQQQQQLAQNQQQQQVQNQQQQQQQVQQVQNQQQQQVQNQQHQQVQQVQNQQQQQQQVPNQQQQVQQQQLQQRQQQAQSQQSLQQRQTQLDQQPPDAVSSLRVITHQLPGLLSEANVASLDASNNRSNLSNPSQASTAMGASINIPAVSNSGGSSTTLTNKTEKTTKDRASSKKNNAKNNALPDKFSTPNEKRRYDRNMREQQRSYKISQQIKELRNVLNNSNIPFKPNKFSILLSTAVYIKQLQSRAMLLDGEHQKLLNSIGQASEMVTTGQLPDEQAESADKSANDANLMFVQGLQYSNIFYQCSAAIAVASLDGRFLDCNVQFEKVSGYTKEELTRETLFNLLTNDDMEEVFKVMGQMLKEDKNADFNARTFWSGVVLQKNRQVDLQMNITMARSPDGTPRFFNCALTST